MSGTQPCRVMREAPPGSQLAGDGDGGGLDEAAERAERVVDRGGLEPAVHHAVLALFVAALAPVVLPGRGLHQLLEGLRVAVLEEITGTLPPAHVAGGVAPRGALVVVLAHEEAGEARRLVEAPAALRVRQDVGEELMGAAAGGDREG